MDTWATSSLTPQLACGWEDDPDLFARTFPMDLRPQGPEIIRTWLFDTVVRAHFEHDVLPWRHVTINGWVLDPDRKKMSKSKGNVITPMNLLEQYGSDAVRYWAASGHPGTDTALDEGQMKVGRRLAIKILNASKFALGVGGDVDPTATGDATAPVDRSLLATLAGLADDVTAAFADFDYARALDHTERFFWGFCDDYLELVKPRAYGEEGETGDASARVTLLAARRDAAAPLRPAPAVRDRGGLVLVAPGSVHQAPWPDAAALHAAAVDGDPAVVAIATDVLGAVRKAKTQAQRSLRTEVTRLVVRDAARAARGAAPRGRRRARRGSASPASSSSPRRPSRRSRSSSRPTRGAEVSDRPRAWLDAHVNLESLGVPAGHEHDAPPGRPSSAWPRSPASSAPPSSSTRSCT